VKVRRGDVVLVDFLFSDRTGSKVRPALAVQDDRWNQTLDDTILALITGGFRRMTGAATQFRIDPTTAEGRQSGLPASSVVRCENLAVFDRQTIMKFLGTLPPVDNGRRGWLPQGGARLDVT
jgi:mRNA interferase MazF